MHGGTNALWVGELDGTGTMIVFDPALQALGVPLVAVYSLTVKEIRIFEPKVLKNQVKTVVDFARKTYAINQYRIWRESEGKDYRQDDIIQAGKSLIETRKKIQEKIQEKHRKFLAERNLPNAGTRVHGSTHHRLAHCWSCKKELDNSIDVECAMCRWIICSCGACGCGRSS